MNKNKLIGISIILLIIILGVVGYVFKNKYDGLIKSTSEGLALGKAYGKL